MKHNLSQFKPKPIKLPFVSFGTDKTVSDYLVKEKMQASGYVYSDAKRCYVPMLMT